MQPSYKWMLLLFSQKNIIYNDRIYNYIKQKLRSVQVYSCSLLWLASFQCWLNNTPKVDHYQQSFKKLRLSCSKNRWGNDLVGLFHTIYCQGSPGFSSIDYFCQEIITNGRSWLSVHNDLFLFIGSYKQLYRYLAFGNTSF